MKKLFSALFVVAALLIAGCDAGKVNKVLPATAVVDAVYSEKLSNWVAEQVGTPKSKSVVMTFWHDHGRSDLNNSEGYLSFVVNGVEGIKPVDNVGGYDFADSMGFKFSYSNGEWLAYIAEEELASREKTPDLYLGDVVEVLKKY
jgi:hypothetical protein